MYILNTKAYNDLHFASLALEDWAACVLSTHSSCHNTHEFLTCISTGYYMYISSQYSNFGQRAWLASPVIRNKRCLTFYYYLIQSPIEEFNVYLKLNSSYSLLVWGLFRPQRTYGWKMGRLPLNWTNIQV